MTSQSPGRAALPTFLSLLFFAAALRELAEPQDSIRLALSLIDDHARNLFSWRANWFSTGRFLLVGYDLAYTENYLFIGGIAALLHWVTLTSSTAAALAVASVSTLSLLSATFLLAPRASRFQVWANALPASALLAFFASPSIGTLLLPTAVLAAVAPFRLSAEPLNPPRGAAWILLAGAAGVSLLAGLIASIGIVASLSLALVRRRPIVRIAWLGFAGAMSLIVLLAIPYFRSGLSSRDMVRIVETSFVRSSRVAPKNSVAPQVFKRLNAISGNEAVFLLPFGRPTKHLSDFFDSTIFRVQQSLLEALREHDDVVDGVRPTMSGSLVIPPPALAQLDEAVRKFPSLASLRALARFPQARYVVYSRAFRRSPRIEWFTKRVAKYSRHITLLDVDAEGNFLLELHPIVPAKNFSVLLSPEPSRERVLDFEVRALTFAPADRGAEVRLITNLRQGATPVTETLPLRADGEWTRVRFKIPRSASRVDAHEIRFQEEVGGRSVEIHLRKMKARERWELSEWESLQQTPHGKIVESPRKPE
ncbi:MAG: hypothetical protein IT290_01415 [Deltaproteobacteria bacterium]|nr:hypothetical protein [Deltaproteobacteria bacterium]